MAEPQSSWRESGEAIEEGNRSGVSKSMDGSPPHLLVHFLQPFLKVTGGAQYMRRDMGTLVIGKNLASPKSKFG